MNARELAARIADGGPVKVSNGTLMVLCPAHHDQNPSLAITTGDADQVVLHCHAGCTAEAILAAVGLAWSDLYPETARDPGLDVEAVYPYVNEIGRTLFEVVRRPGKQFRQRVPDGRQPSGYRWNLQGIERVLYRLPEVMAAVIEGREVWVVEGEKDADALNRHVTATTNPGGAGKWRAEYSEVLAGSEVTIWADADDPGRAHARAVRDSLLAAGAVCRIVESPSAKDAHAHLGAGLGLDDVMVTVPFEQSDTVTLFEQANSYLEVTSEPKPWALRNLLRKGEVVILTGWEGWGKSALLKQIAVCAAVGLDPFEFAKVQDPVRVLFIDCENSREDCQEDFRRLRDAARGVGVWDNPPLWICTRDELNLLSPDGFAWLVERVTAHKPDLLVIGPLYDLYQGDLGKEATATGIKRVFNYIRHELGCAIALEAHSPHRAPGEQRDVRPIGSSLLLRWPSYGYGLRPTGRENEPFDLVQWRGARRRGRAWPLQVEQTEGWYWQRYGVEDNG